MQWMGSTSNNTLNAVELKEVTESNFGCDFSSALTNATKFTYDVMQFLRSSMLILWQMAVVL